jgi:hypothetical protein
MNRKTVLIASGGVIAAMLLVSLAAALRLPPDVQIPIHWGDAGGAPDRFAGREGVLFFPLIAVAVTALLGMCPPLKSKGASYLWS